MPRCIRLGAISILLLIGIGTMSGCRFFEEPWEGTWWGVQEAGMNWSGDNIRNLETFVFTKEGDAVTVQHQVQRGAKEVAGDLTGTGQADGGRLTITPSGSSKTVTFTYSRTEGTIETSLTNSDKTPVVLKKLTEENNTEMEQIRKEIIAVSQKPENAVNTTISQTIKSRY